MQQFRIIRLGLALLTALILSPHLPRGSLAADAFHPDGDGRRRVEEDARSRDRRDEDAVARSREPWRGEDNTNRPQQEFHDADALEAKIESQRKREVILDDKIQSQMPERGWTEREIRDLTNGKPSGTSVDNTGGRNEPATVYGDPGKYVIVNDASRRVVQVSDKIGKWDDDPRIKWNATR